MKRQWKLLQYNGDILDYMGFVGLYWGCIGLMENKVETTIQGLKSRFRVSGFGCRVSKNQCMSSYQKCLSVPEVKVALCFEILGHTGLVRRNRLDRGVATHNFASSRWTGRVSIDGWSILVLGQVHKGQGHIIEQPSSRLGESGSWGDSKTII